MFDEIAPVYDRLNTVMTLGADRRWRATAVAGDGRGRGGLRNRRRLRNRQARGRARGARGAVRARARRRSVGRDGRARVRAPTATWSSSNSSPATPWRSRPATAEFDAATIAFGLRNLADFESGFRELCRVVRPGGRVICLELTVPRPRAWAVVYHGTFRRVSPILGGLAGHRDAYRYLPTSLDGFPRPRDLAATMRRAGLVDVAWRRLALGTVALHSGRVPAP